MRSIPRILGKRAEALTPRKHPRQARAQATVDAILQATTYILSRSSWSTLTTNGIAARAGVNIASLYQYFPNKVAIIAELRRRHIAQSNTCGAHAETPKTLREALEQSVRRLVAEQRKNPELHRVFDEELPRRDRFGIEAGEPPSTARDDPWLTEGLADLELAGFVARTAARAVIREAALERPALLDEPRFAEEVVTLLERYLSRPLGR